MQQIPLYLRTKRSSFQNWCQSLNNLNFGNKQPLPERQTAQEVSRQREYIWHIWWRCNCWSVVHSKRNSVILCSFTCWISKAALYPGIWDFYSSSWSEKSVCEIKSSFGVYLGKKVKCAQEKNETYTGALCEPDHLGKSLWITVKLRTGVADTVDTLSTKETAFICRSPLNYASKFRKAIC